MANILALPSLTTEGRTIITLNMKTRLLSCLLAASATLCGQTFDWAKSFGGTWTDYGNSITTDASGNVYTTGSFSGTVDFNPGTGTTNLTSAGNDDMFIQKLDASGNFVWAKKIGGTSDDYGYFIQTDASGNIYITGSFAGTVDFDPGTGTSNLTSNGGDDIFVMKMDATGNLLWAKSLGGTSYDLGYALYVDASGNVFITGSFAGTVDFDPGTATVNLTSVGSDDIFVQKLSSSGSFVWAKSFGGTGDDYGNSIKVDASGNVYLAGSFMGTVDFDPGTATTNLASVGGEDIFVQKLNASGNFLWAKSFGGASDDIANCISLDASGNIFTTGIFELTVDFDPGASTTNLTSAGNTDLFVQKMDSSGNFIWAHAFGSASNDFGNSINTDVFGNVYMTGIYSGTIDFDPGSATHNLTSAGFDDVIILKLNTSGNFVWAQSFGGSYFDYGFATCIDALGTIYTVGSFSSTADLDPGTSTDNHTSSGFEDIYVQKISQCFPNTGTDVIAACGSYTWLDSNTYTTNNNTATYILTNAGGCDSVVTLDLTINNPTSGTDVITACNSYMWIDGNTYTTSNSTATHALTNAVGCDSIVTLNLTLNSVSDITTSLSGITISANNSNANYQWLDCNNNYAPISGETNQSFTATSNGNYAVALSENGCTDTSACVSINSVGIHELKNSINASVYPNPSSGTFRVSFEQTLSNVEFVITDLQGAIISKKHYSSAATLDIELNAAIGIYLLNIRTEEGQNTVRLIKE